MSANETTGTSRWNALRCDGAAGILAAATATLHLLTADGYGIFRDELYYLACAEHLSWGYVDHPPFVAVLAWIVRHLLGTSLFALRLLPALAAGVLVLLSAAVARQLGAGRYAQLLTGVAVALAPQYLGMLSVYSMNALDLVLWAALALVTVRIFKTDDRRGWLLFGVLAGFGLQNKLSVLFFCFGLAAGLLVERRWNHLRDRSLWQGAGLAGLIFAPHILWQMANGWPTAEFIRRATEIKNIAYGPVDFLVAQTRMMNPATLPLWLAGLGTLLFAKNLRRYRPLGWAYPAILLVMITRGGKPYYLAPIYPLLLAAGAVALERATRGRGGSWIRWPVFSAIVLTGGLIAPLAKPLLPVDKYVAYAEALGIEPGTDERHRLGRLPQFFADMHGWQELAEVVARVHRELPSEERGQACLFALNYGQAGAIDFFGPALGLPRAISGHNSYWLWGPGDCTGEIIVIIGGQREDHLRSFAQVLEGGHFECRDCMPVEGNQTVWIARGLRAPVADVWPHIKHFE
jgi:hypothetical protein